MQTATRLCEAAEGLLFLDELTTAPPAVQAAMLRVVLERVVGVDIHEGSHGWQTHVIEFFAIGTAVLPLEKEIAPEQIADPIMVFSVNDSETRTRISDSVRRALTLWEPRISVLGVNVETKDRAFAIHPAMEPSLPFGLATFQTTAAFRNVKIRSLD